MAIQFRANNEIASHVPDLARAEEFYEKTLCFSLVNKNPGSLEFDMDALRVYVNRSAGERWSYIPSLDA